jgi:hypothetical protein
MFFRSWSVSLLALVLAIAARPDSARCDTLDERAGFVLLELLDQISIIRSLQFAVRSEEVIKEATPEAQHRSRAIEREFRYWWQAGSYRLEFTQTIPRGGKSQSVPLVVIYDGKRYQCFTPTEGGLGIADQPHLYLPGGFWPNPLALPFSFVLWHEERPLEWSNLSERMVSGEVWSRAIWKGWQREGGADYAVFDFPGKVHWRVYFSKARGYYPEKSEATDPGGEGDGLFRVEQFQELEIGGRRVWLPLAVKTQHRSERQGFSSEAIHRVVPETLRVNASIGDSIFTIPQEEVRRVFDVHPFPRGQAETSTSRPVTYYLRVMLYIGITLCLVGIMGIRIWRKLARLSRRA